MAIYAPGIRNRKNRKVKKHSRRVLAVLSLTAMVDMFTVLVVFLLQNYNLTGQVIHLPKDVELPKAATVKELKPAHIIMISNEGIHLDDVRIGKLGDLNSEDWLIQSLYTQIKKAFEIDLSEKQGIRSKVRTAIKETKGQESIENDRKVTVQADKKIKFGLIKKVMYTLVEAGAGEINFAVEKNLKKEIN